MGFENKPLPIHPGDLIMRRIRVLGSQQNSREYQLSYTPNLLQA